MSTAMRSTLQTVPESCLEVNRAVTATSNNAVNSIDNSGNAATSGGAATITVDPTIVPSTNNTTTQSTTPREQHTPPSTANNNIHGTPPRDLANIITNDTSTNNGISLHDQRFAASAAAVEHISTPIATKVQGNGSATAKQPASKVVESGEAGGAGPQTQPAQQQQPAGATVVPAAGTTVNSNSDAVGSGGGKRFSSDGKREKYINYRVPMVAVQPGMVAITVPNRMRVSF